MAEDRDVGRVSPMADDDSVSSHVRRPTRVPSIKIEPPCEIDYLNDESSCMTTLSTSSSNYNALSPSMSPSQRSLVDLRNQPGNYKKNLTARFLQQGQSEDDGYYRSENDLDMVQPDEKRSKSLDRGLEYDSTEVQPLDLTNKEKQSPSFSTSSSDDIRNRFEARARKMHRRHRADSEENLTHLLQLSTPEHLMAMQKLSQSDVQLDRLKRMQPTPSGLINTDNATSPSSGEANDQNITSLSGSASQPTKNFMPLPSISMLYNRGTSSSSTDGSLDLDKSSPFTFLPGSNIPINPAIAASLCGHLTEAGGALSPIPGMNISNFNMATYLELHQMRNRLNQTLVNQCFICKQTFPGFDNMAKHVAKHLPTEVKTDNNNRVHVCKVCNRSFSRSDMLTRHMRLHTGLKPYECKECSQVFSRSDHLNTHKRTHTGEKPYQCPKCPYAACRRDMITRHMRIHTNKDAATKKRRRLGMLYCKDSVSGSSVESTDSTPSRGGSISGNSFEIDSSFESSELRWPTPRHLLDPSDLIRNPPGRSWSAPNSFDNADYGRNRTGAWSSFTSADSTESDVHIHPTSFDGEYMSPPPKISTSMSAAVFSMPTPVVSTEHNLSGFPFSMKNRRPSLVRQDASLDQQEVTNQSNGYMSSNLPFNDYKTKLAYRNSNESKSMDCSDEVASIGKDSADTVDSPRTAESPLPVQDMVGNSPAQQVLKSPYLPNQASLSDELNLQKCVLDE